VAKRGARIWRAHQQLRRQIVDDAHKGLGDLDPDQSQQRRGWQGAEHRAGDRAGVGTQDRVQDGQRDQRQHHNHPDRRHEPVVRGHGTAGERDL